MVAKTERDINGVVARQIRERAKLTQRLFWESVGLTQSCGCRYEKGGDIPRPVRILIFITYVAGLRIDASTESGAAGLMQLATLQASENAAEREAIGAKLQTVLNGVREAKDVLESI